jgi:hypothetical protein
MLQKVSLSSIIAVVSTLVALTLGVALYLATNGPGIDEASSNSESIGGGKTTHDVTGTFMVNGYFGPAGGSCDYYVDDEKTTCLEKAIQKGDALIAGKTFPAPEGPGGGFSDFKDGAQIVLRDGDNKVLSVGELFGGKLAVEGVSFEFSLDDVPETDIYELSTGNREPLVYQLKDMQDAGWNLDLSIG